MKKVILFTLAVGVITLSFAQQKHTRTTNVLTKTPLQNVLESENKAIGSTTVPEITETIKHRINPTNMAVNCIDLGMSGNAYGSAFGARTSLYANNALNTVVLTRRSTFTENATTVFYRFDVSKDGGATFALAQGPLYSDPLDVMRGRYPQGVIFPNPNYPTIADSAFVADRKSVV